MACPPVIAAATSVRDVVHRATSGKVSFECCRPYKPASRLRLARFRHFALAPDPDVMLSSGGSETGYAAHFLPEWSPGMEGVKEKLERGALRRRCRCGHGASTICRRSIARSRRKAPESKTACLAAMDALRHPLYLQNLVAALPEEFSRRPASITLLAIPATTLGLKNKATEPCEGDRCFARPRSAWRRWHCLVRRSETFPRGRSAVISVRVRGEASSAVAGSPRSARLL